MTTSSLNAITIEQFVLEAGFTPPTDRTVPDPHIVELIQIWTSMRIGQHTAALDVGRVIDAIDSVVKNPELAVSRDFLRHWHAFSGDIAKAAIAAMGDAPAPTVLQEADHNQPSPASEQNNLSSEPDKVARWAGNPDRESFPCEIRLIKKDEPDKLIMACEEVLRLMGKWSKHYAYSETCERAVSALREEMRGHLRRPESDIASMDAAYELGRLEDTKPVSVKLDEQTKIELWALADTAISRPGILYEVDIVDILDAWKEEGYILCKS